MQKSLYCVLQMGYFPYLVFCRGNTLCIWHFAIRRYFPYMMLCRKLFQPIIHDYTNHCYYPYMVFCRRHLPYMVSYKKLTCIGFHIPKDLPCMVTSFSSHSFISCSNGLINGEPLIVCALMMWSSSSTCMSSTDDRIDTP